MSDGVYGILSVNEVGKRISNLGHEISSNQVSNDDIQKKLNEITQLLKKLNN